MALTDKLPHDHRHHRRICRQYATYIVLASALLVINGCSILGARNVRYDRFDYNAEIARSTNEQLLLNLVRLRYGNSPLFLDVTSVITQYQLIGELGLSGSLVSGASAVAGDSATAEGRAIWSERPTISYAPRTGPEYTLSLLTPIPPAAVFEFVTAIWPFEEIIWLVVQSINGVKTSNTQLGDWNPDYVRMIDLLLSLADTPAITLGSRRRAQQLSGTVVFSPIDDPIKAEAVAELRNMWRLDPSIDSFRLVYGEQPTQADEIAVVTTSVLELLKNFSSFIEVPPEHVRDGRTFATVTPPPYQPQARPPILVRATEFRPSDAFTAVEKDGWWYSISHNDLQSKRLFSLLNVLLEFSASSQRQTEPVITVGAGG